MPWVNHGLLNAKAREIEEPKKELERLAGKLTARDLEESVPVVTDTTEAERKPVSQTPPPLPSVTPVAVARTEAPPEKPRPTAAVVTKPAVNIQSPKKDQRRGDWFGKLTVWVGGVALLVAG